HRRRPWPACRRDRSRASLLSHRGRLSVRVSLGPCETAMARPIWTGTLSFGLLNVPVSLMSGERRVDISFRMLDSRDNNPVRYERVNAETGEEVPWKDVVKAFEYDKGSYVVLEQD